jgi:uncharacterized membrane protein
VIRAGHVSDLPQAPATTADEQIGRHGAIAVVLTRWVGSMPTLYAALVIVGGWMTLATWGPLHRIDPYPFPFLLFLDNVVQLVLCLVILVGQRLLGGAADRRAVQTYEDAEAIFEQVADLQGHLDGHDLALSRGVSLLESSPHPWIERHRVQAPPQAIDQAVTVNDRIAAWLTKRLGTMWAFYLAAGTQLQLLAWLEHERWMRERTAAGFELGPTRDGRTRPDLVPWDLLSDEARTKNLQAVQRIPDVVAGVGFQVLRHSRGAQDGLWVADSDPLSPA